MYLADSIRTCFAEKMFYFQREIVRRLDALHQPLSPGVPAFSGAFTLWDIRLKKPVADVCHLTQASASAVGVFPSLMLNPSQDYEHLKDRRAFIENNGYNGSREGWAAAQPHLLLQFLPGCRRPGRGRRASNSA